MSKHSKGVSPEQMAKYTGSDSPLLKEEAKKRELEEQARLQAEREAKERELQRELTPEEQQMEKEVKDFVKFLAKSDFKTKEAACEGKRLTYFRGDDFMNFVKEKADEVHKLMPTFLGNLKLNEDKGPEKLLQALIDLEAMLSLERSGQEEKKYKYPKYLEWSRSRAASEKGFYYCAVNIESKTRGIMMYLILAGVVAICLFQVWPLWLKIAVFYISVVMLYAIIGLILVRYAFYFTIRILGIDFWIFPNLFEDVSVIDSFKPILSVSRAKDSGLMYLIRVVGAVVLAYLVYTVYHQPEILQGYKDAGVESFEDIIEWGKEKLDPNQTLVMLKGGARIKNLETILNETEDHADDDEYDTTHHKKSKSHEDPDLKKKEKEKADLDEADDYGDVELNRDSA